MTAEFLRFQDLRTVAKNGQRTRNFHKLRNKKDLICEVPGGGGVDADLNVDGESKDNLAGVVGESMMAADAMPDSGPLHPLFTQWPLICYTPKERWEAFEQGIRAVSSLLMIVA